MIVYHNAVMIGSLNLSFNMTAVVTVLLYEVGGKDFSKFLLICLNLKITTKRNTFHFWVNHCSRFSWRLSKDQTLPAFTTNKYKCKAYKTSNHCN